MATTRYKLTIAGKLGAALFVGSPTIAAFRAIPIKPDNAQQRLSQKLADISGEVLFLNQKPEVLIALGALTLMGAVLVLVGREAITIER